MSQEKYVQHKIIFIENVNFGTFALPIENSHKFKTSNLVKKVQIQNSSKSLSPVLVKSTKDVIRLSRSPRLAGKETTRILSLAQKLKSLNHKNLIEILNVDWNQRHSQNQGPLSGTLQISTLSIQMSYSKPLQDHLDYQYKWRRWKSHPLRYVIVHLIHLYTGLKFLHQNGIIHQNLNPTTIFVEDAIGLKIGGFGATCLAQLPPSDTGVTFSRSNEFSYESPEQKRGKEVTFKSDIYSAGMVTFAMLRRMSLPSEQMAALKEIQNKILPPNIRPPFQEDVKSMLFAMLNYKSKNRPSLESPIKILTDFTNTYGWNYVPYI